MVLSTNITCFKEFLFNREKLDWKIGFTACKQNLPENFKQMALLISFSNKREETNQSRDQKSVVRDHS